MSLFIRSTMQILAFVLVCLACEGHARRVQLASERIQSGLHEGHGNAGEGNPDADNRKPKIQEGVQRIAEQMKSMVTVLNSLEEVKRVAEQTKEVMTDTKFQAEAKRLAEPMMDIMDDAEQLTTVLVDPSFQEQARRFAKPIVAMMDDSTFQEKAQRFADHVKALRGDPNSHWKAMRAVEQVNQIVGNPHFKKTVKGALELLLMMMATADSREEAQHAAEQLKALISEPKFQQQLHHVAEPMMGMMPNVSIRHEVTVAAEQIVDLMADPAFQAEARRVLEPMMAMVSDARPITMMMSDPKFRQQANRFIEPLKVMLADPRFQRKAKRVADQMKAISFIASQMKAAMDTDPKPQSLAEVGQQVTSSEASHPLKALARIFGSLEPSAGFTNPGVQLFGRRPSNAGLYSGGRTPAMRCDDMEGDPTLSIITNVALGERKMEVMKSMSKAVASSLGKPESYVAVLVEDGKDLIRGGTDDPAAVGTCYSLGSINKQNNGALTKKVSDILAEFGVAPDRIYINFFDVPRENCGYNGQTFAG